MKTSESMVANRMKNIEMASDAAPLMSQLSPVQPVVHVQPAG